jgi:beta-glucanase (GH16 family)
MKRHMYIWIMPIIIICGCDNNSNSALSESPPDEWKLVWSDEFDSTDINLKKWTFETGGGGWGNNEKEYYRKENAFISNGNLVIEARKEQYDKNEYTSARMKTAGLGEWLYGKIEARMKLPFGKGMWPAFWMMGKSGSWPSRGEIDIMEMIGGPGLSPYSGGADNKVYATLHWANDAGDHQSTGGNYRLPGTGKFADDYHIFRLEWDSVQIQCYVDSTKYFHCRIDTINMEAFHQPFFIILNVAVGGSWPGDPDATTVFPQYMIVDWIRVYQKGK